ncbi:ATP-binding protein [Streptomyces stackebrandtii]|uniref:ATP-binding protein n=1 Tax=Streptomyces stackebrandtii TaxID=3051177 RepID=UPI0028DB6C85|nr:ATP-binding protein [Streptomyces sp. DSM 40976]
MSERRSPERILVYVPGAGDENVVARCRDFTRHALAEWEWPPPGTGDDGLDPDTEDVLLLVSELVANARLHGEGLRSLVLRLTGDGLRIEVTDRSPALPALQRPSDLTRPGGHGLLIVDRLARRWGAEPVDGGKRVWLEVAAPRRLTSDTAAARNLPGDLAEP